MAGLSGMHDRVLTPITAGQQFRAIAYLRWRLFANGFRRKGGKGELVARIIVYPVGLFFLLGIMSAAGASAWAAVHQGHLDAIGGVFLGITVLQIIVSINISQPGLSFDPESLIRFPVTFPRYLIVRLFLGLLSASTIVGTCSFLMAAVGITIAQPGLWVIAFAAAIVLSVTNMLFIRMIFAWIDRWLSTRRARELFTGVIILFSLGVQYLNVTFNSGFNRHDPASQRRKVAAAMHFYHSWNAILSHFPAGLAGVSVLNVAHGYWLYALANLVAICLFGAVFLAIFAWRMEREYRGENLSDSSGSPNIQAPVARSTRAVPQVALAASATPEESFLPAALNACFYKEWIYVRRNTAQLYGMLGPLAMVALFASKLPLSFSRAGYSYPAAICYSTLGVAALAYNSFGLDAAGVQFYFIAPVRLHTILLAKNLFSFVISAIEAVIVYIVLSFVTGPPPLMMTAAALCWLVFAVLVNVTVGNIRSIIAPKKMDPGKLSRKQASQFSALMSFGILFLLAVLGFGMIVLGEHLNLPWLPIPVFLTLAIAAAIVYVLGLNHLDALSLKHRETMIEELCKAS